MTPRRVADTVLVGLFLTGLAGYGGASTWNAVADRAKAAALARLEWQVVPTDTEKFFTDHLVARDALVACYCRVVADWLGASPTPKVWRGRDGWLFYNYSAEAGFISPNDPELPSRLDRWAATLSARRAWLADRGIHYLVLAAPDKQTIYPEYMPRLGRRRGPTPLDGLLARCARDPSLSVLDLREPLKAARPTGRLYRLADSHWSPAGNYVCYAATVGAIARWYPGQAPRPRSDYGTELMQFRGGDLARMMRSAGPWADDLPGLVWTAPPRARQVAEQVFGEADARLQHVATQVWVNDTPGLPRVVVFGDSFAANLLCPLLSEHCSRLVRVGSFEAQEALIERERPDLVIFEFVERALESYVPKPPKTGPASRRQPDVVQLQNMSG